MGSGSAMCVTMRQGCMLRLLGAALELQLHQRAAGQAKFETYWQQETHLWQCGGDTQVAACECFTQDTISGHAQLRAQRCLRVMGNAKRRLPENIQAPALLQHSPDDAQVRHLGLHRIQAHRIRVPHREVVS